MDRPKPIALNEESKNDKAAHYGEIFFRLIILVLAVIGIFRKDWIVVYHGSLLYHALMTMAISYIPDMVRKATKIYITAEFRLIFLLFVFSSQLLGEIADFYVMVPLWDKMAHLISAFFLTIIGYVTVYIMTDDVRTGKRVSLRFATIFAFSFSMLFGTFWEIFEYLMDISFGLKMQKSGLVDTMEDLIVCLAGSLIPCMIYVYDVKNKKNSFIVRMITRFVEKNKKSENK
jgi:hypothetical protein